MFSTVPNRLRALRELRSVSDALWLAYIGAVAAIVPLLVRLPVQRWAGLITHPPRSRPASGAEAERLERLVGLAPRIAGPLVRPGCLTRGLTLFWFLRRAGFEVELHFGLDPDDPVSVEGHCWLALDGDPFLEKVDPRPRFAEIYRLPLVAQ